MSNSLLGHTPTTYKHTFARLGHNLETNGTRTFRIDGLDEEVVFADCMNCGSTFYVATDHIIGSDAADFCSKPTNLPTTPTPQLEQRDNDAIVFATTIASVQRLQPGHVHYSEPWMFGEIVVTCHIANNAYRDHPNFYYYKVNGVSVGNMHGLMGTLLHMFDNRPRVQPTTDGLEPWVVTMQLFGDKEETWTFHTLVVPALSFDNANDVAFKECQRLFGNDYSYSRRPVVTERLSEGYRPKRTIHDTTYRVEVCVEPQQEQK